MNYCDLRGESILDRKLGDFPIFIDPQTYNLTITVPAFNTSNCIKRMDSLLFFCRRVAGTIVMTRYGNTHGTMMVNRYLQAIENLLHDVDIGLLCQYKVWTGLGNRINIIHTESFLQIFNYRQLNPSIHTVYNSAKTHNIPL